MSSGRLPGCGRFMSFGQFDILQIVLFDHPLLRHLACKNGGVGGEDVRSEGHLIEMPDQYRQDSECGLPAMNGNRGRHDLPEEESGEGYREDENNPCGGYDETAEHQTP